MDFNEFRKKKMEEKKQKEEEEQRATQPTASGQAPDWIDGMGPAGPRNPKVKGFVLGRYQRKRVDPSTLQRPEGYERTNMSAEEDAPAATKAELEIEKRKAAIEKAQADLEKAQEAARLAEIEERKKREGISQIKGRQRF
ncbi:MAG: hypothetical protein AB7N76_29765 [Planctomycetota bacterium]